MPSAAGVRSLRSSSDAGAVHVSADMPFTCHTNMTHSGLAYLEQQEEPDDVDAAVHAAHHARHICGA